MTVVLVSSVSRHSGSSALGQPDQLSNSEELSAVAVTVTGVPGSKSCSQVPGQSIVLSSLVTVPLPGAPARVRLSSLT